MDDNNIQVVVVHTDRAQSISPEGYAGKTFRLNSKAMLLGRGIQMTEEGPQRMYAVFPANAWMGSDVVHLTDRLESGEAMRCFGIHPIVVPVEDVDMLPPETLFVPDSVEQWCKENPLEEFLQ